MGLVCIAAHILNQVPHSRVAEAVLRDPLVHVVLAIFGGTLFAVL